MRKKPFPGRSAISFVFRTVILAISLFGFTIAGPLPVTIHNESLNNHISPTQPVDNLTFQECVSHTTVSLVNVIGAGGHLSEPGKSPSEDMDQWPPSGYAERACWIEVVKTIDPASLDPSIDPFRMLPAAIFQLELSDPLLADGQFVWGPNVGDFDIRSYLRSKGSPLEPYSDEIEIWARYTTVNPKILLTVLELQHGYMNALSADLPPETIREIIENTSMQLATAFYEHLYTWGTRKDQTSIDQNPVVVFADGTAAQLSPDHSSGTFAIAATLAESTDMTTWQTQISTSDQDGFTSIFDSLFPETDRLDNSNNINPPDLPTADLFQFPFPLGATWHFNGPHSWAGDDTPPFSSMDFYTGGGTCDAPPNSYTVAAASGTAIRPYGYDCWLEIDHGEGWTTSYYHLQNMIDPQGAIVHQNTSLGTIACEVCAGGWATGPHVHWSLKYGGAYVSLEGVKISGWTIHVGPEPYDTGYIERRGQILDPFSTVLNDYHLYYPTENTSLRFNGNGENDIDRVKISINDPPRPVDLGSTDLTIEWWMKANPGENNAGNCIPGGQNWESGNHIFDRSVHQEDGSGEFGVSLADGRIVFGVNNGTESDTLCGITDVADGNWHHVAITRGLDGSMRIFIDGTLDIETTGPLGDISYPDGRSETHPNDPYLVVGSEKFDIDPFLYPSFNGWIDEIHFSNTIRYLADFTPSTDPTTPDGNSVALYHFDEGVGDFINDTSGAWGGPSNGSRSFGGDPAGPEWSTETPIIKPIIHAVPADFDGDGDTDISIFKIETGNGIWHIYDHAPLIWGGSDSIPVPGDFDGDREIDIAVYSEEIWGGTWFIKDQTTVSWGGSTSVPVPGDYDGDGDTDIAVYQIEAWGGTWYIKDQTTISWGGSDSIPVPADYDGDGDTDIAVYHVEPWGGTWYIKDQPTVSWGGSESNPIPADYDGDGDADIAVFHQEPWGATWYIKDQSTVSWGGSNSIPVPGDYDGDGDIDIAVYDVTTLDGIWYIKDLLTQTWGSNEDFPLPAHDFDGDGKPY